MSGGVAISLMLAVPDASAAAASYPFADGGELSADGDEDRRRQRHL